MNGRVKLIFIVVLAVRVLSALVCLADVELSNLLFLLGVGLSVAQRRLLLAPAVRVEPLPLAWLERSHESRVVLIEYILGRQQTRGISGSLLPQIDVRSEVRTIRPVDQIEVLVVGRQS